MTAIPNRAAWRDVLAATREFNRDRSAAGPYDVRPYWRVMAYRAHAGKPEPIVRAEAMANVLDHVSLHLYEGEMIVGSRAGFASHDIPGGLSATDHEAVQAEHKERGRRDFWAGHDHTLADYPTLLAEGIGGLIARAETSWKQHAEPDRRVFLEAVIITLEAFSRYVGRHADACRKAGRAELAEALDRVVRQPPRTLHEAMLLVWLTHMVFVSQDRYANALGRIDQYLLPFYRRDLADGRLTREQALDLFCHLWAHIEELGEVTNIAIGGLTPDGQDATNELSYVCLEATAAVLSPHTNLSARFHDDSPEAFHRACFECIRTGVGFPAIFNDHVLIQGLEEIGIPLPVARDYCMVGCIETMLAGRQPAWSDSRFDTPKYLLQSLQRLRTEPQRTYERLMELFQEELRSGFDTHAANVNRYIAQFPVERFPDPFLSAVTRHCIERGLDINAGGAEYPRFHGVGVMGLATVADSLAAVKKLVFEERSVDFDSLMAALDASFQGCEPLRQQMMNRAPKYGNADPYVDDIAAWLVSFVSDECLRHTVVGGGRFVSAIASNVQNISAGRTIGATPDGRLAGTPLSDAASPYFGRDMNGPTAFLQSVAAPDYHNVLTGSVVNMKLEPEFFRGEEGARLFSSFTHALVRDRIQELQFNFTGNETLRKAQEKPEAYGNLVVRVSGFSAYFTRLGRDVQDDIIRRRAHTGQA